MTTDPSAKRRAIPLGHFRVRLCREGAYYLGVCAFVLLGSILRDVNLLLVVACMMIGPFVLNGLAALAILRRLRLARMWPRSVESGYPWAAHYLIDNHSGRTAAWTLQIEDQLVSASTGRSWPVSAQRAYVPSRQSVDLPFTGPPLPRGLFRGGPLHVRTRFPFGLLAASAQAITSSSKVATSPSASSSPTTAACDLIVTPRLGQLGSQWTSWLQRAERTGRTGGNRNGRSEGEFHSMRDWRFGDPRKWIHWRTTARRNRLTVREWEVAQSHDLVVLLDLTRRGPSPAATVGDAEIERLISFTATVIARQCVRGGTRIGLGIAGQSVDWIVGSASPLVQDELLRRLAVAEPTPISTLPPLLSRLAGQIPADALVLLVAASEPSWPAGELPRLALQSVYVPVLSNEFATIFSLPNDATAPTPTALEARSIP